MFLPVGSYNGERNAPCGELKWAGSDTEELFDRNVRTQSPDWYYRTHTVRYTNNSEGYRTREFKDVKWDEAIVLVGCSNTYGVGLDDSDTVSYQLELLTGLPIVNLGVSGSSMTYALHNSIILREEHPTPRAIVYLWPDYGRCVEYNKDTVDNHGPWDADRSNFSRVWCGNEYNAKTHAIFIQKNIRLLWKDTAIYEGTFASKSVALALNCEYLDRFDTARDLMHPGRVSTKCAAEKIAKELSL